MIIVVTSESAVKIKAVKEIFKDSNPTIIPTSTKNAPLPDQPINSGFVCADTRIDFVENNFDIKYDYIISIENGIDTVNHYKKGGDHHNYVDICYVIIKRSDGKKFYGESYGIPIDKKYINEARNETNLNYKFIHLGLSISAGRIINRHYPNIPHDDWMCDSMFFGKSRFFQILDAIRKCFDTMP